MHRVTISFTIIREHVDFIKQMFGNVFWFIDLAKIDASDQNPLRNEKVNQHNP